MAELFASYDIFGAFFATLRIAVLAAIGSLILGTIIAVFRLSPFALLRGLGAGYINVFRNIPLTVLCVFMMLAMHSNLRVVIADNVIDTSFRWGVIALILYHATYVCEALRTGFNTVPLGQAEAARAIGLTFTQNLTSVVLPQAFRGAIVPLGSALIALIKNTTVVAVIGVAQISYLMTEMVENDSDKIFSIFAIVALGFVIITLPLGLLTTHFGTKLAVKR
ncbi:MAG: amino acid ABC transporter permease [Dermatophilus congolensis]|nr:amino acid ABC transporter permease [Dermatophilus congolensis]